MRVRGARLELGMKLAVQAVIPHVRQSLGHPGHGREFFLGPARRQPLGERDIVVCHQRPEFIDALQVVLLEIVEGRAIGIPCRTPWGEAMLAG